MAPLHVRCCKLVAQLVTWLLQAICLRCRGCRCVTEWRWIGRTNTACCTTSGWRGSMCVCRLASAKHSGMRLVASSCMCRWSFVEYLKAARTCGGNVLLDAQVLVIADPVIVAEVLHAHDFDKVPEVSVR